MQIANCKLQIAHKSYVPKKVYPEHNIIFNLPNEIIPNINFKNQWVQVIVECDPKAISLISFMLKKKLCVHIFRIIAVSVAM